MEAAILPRLAASLLTRALDVSPVVVLTGGRQTGKSTLVQTLPALQGRAYATLDDLLVRGQAESEPDDLVLRAPLLTLDEVQRAPALILAIKRAVDRQRPRQRGRFVLTGSANLLLMKRVSETLAGRATYVTLWPLTRRERFGAGRAGIWGSFFDLPAKDWHDLVQSEQVPAEDWREAARIGGYPTPAHELTGHEARSIWFGGYVQTYLERDLRDLAAVDSLVDFRRFMRAAALRVGSLLNQAEIGRDAAIPRSSIHRYINLLETSYQVVRLEPYSVNRTKRLIKTPKLYWADPGLALFLSGEEPGGKHLENLVLADLIAWRDGQFVKPEILYWRTVSDQEVDFVIERGHKLLPIEVKATARPSHHDVRHLKAFCEEYGSKVVGAVLLHTGNDAFWLGKDILAAPWWRVV